MGKCFGVIAQLGERYNGIVEVGGSIPPGSTKSSFLSVIKGAKGLLFFKCPFYDGASDYKRGGALKAPS